MMSDITLEQALQLGLSYHQAGQTRKAETQYRKILEMVPIQPDALHLLGVIAYNENRPQDAVHLIRQAIENNGHVPDYHAHLALAYRSLGMGEQESACWQKLVLLQPASADAWNNLGYSLQLRGNFAEAETAFRQALALQPNHAIARYHLALVLQQQQRLDEAIACYQQALALRPELVEAYNNLGVALFATGRIDEAIHSYRRALNINPKHADTHFNLGGALGDQGLYGEAITCFQKALEIRPHHAATYYNLGVAFYRARQYTEAAASHRRAAELDPQNGQAYDGLGSVFKELGRLPEAVAAYREAVRRSPDRPTFHSNLLFALHYDPDCTPAILEAEHQLWQQRHGVPRQTLQQPHHNIPLPDRRLKIGYVSTDFRDHALGRNILPLLRYHNHRDFEIFCYADVLRPDAVTADFQTLADHWISIRGWSDATLAERVRNDEIDIFVDLAQHMDGNRLLVFATKPAPVQVSFAGYPSITGLDAIDYRLTDSYLEPEDDGLTRRHEKPMRLPNAFWCYEPRATEPTPHPSPMINNGFITFGCLNNFCKINDAVIALWSRLLRSLPESRLLIIANPGGQRERILAAFEKEQINPDRIECSPRVTHAEYLALHNRVDAMLDTFPYNGHTSICDALWMGVPVVTLAGKTSVSRGGWSILANVGLSELIAHSEEDYLRIASELAADLPKMIQLRSELRTRMQASPLMDGPSFALGIEAAYRSMWQNWCEQRQTKSSGV